MPASATTANGITKIVTSTNLGTAVGSGTPQA